MMNKSPNLLLAATLIFFIVMIPLFAVSAEPVPAASEKSVASFESVSGNIKYDKSGMSGYTEIEKEKAAKMELFTSDMVMTENNTTAEIKTTYGAKLKILENTELQINYFNVRIKKGATWINFKPVKSETGDVKFRVSTPVGTIGIKGTEFMVNYDPAENKMKVGVKEGVISVDNLAGTESVELKQDQMVTVEAGKSIPEPVKFSPLPAELIKERDREEFLETNDIPVNTSGKRIIRKRN